MRRRSRRSCSGTTGLRRLPALFASRRLRLWGHLSYIVNAGGAVSYLGEEIDRAARRARAHEGNPIQLYAVLEAQTRGAPAGIIPAARGDGDEPGPAVAARARARLRARRQEGVARLLARGPLCRGAAPG